MSNTYEIIVETGWSETFEVKASSLAEALELIDNNEVDPLSYGKVGDQKYNLRVRGSNKAAYKEIIGGQIRCDCDDPCEQDKECPCNNIPCEDDEGICEHTRGCLHGECECGCEF